MSSEQGRKNIVIIGGGIIGCTTAYYLTRHPLFEPKIHKITLLEATKIAGGSSGKAGGLLGLWAYPANIVPLSFRLHSELAAEHGGGKRWGYRRIHCGQLGAKGRPTAPSGQKQEEGPKSKSGDRTGDAISLQKLLDQTLGKLQAAGIPDDLDWVSPDSVMTYDGFGDPSNTAQVHPHLFTTTMAALAAEKGVDIRVGAMVTAINRDPKTDSVNSVSYTEKATSQNITLSATDVIISAGPWTSTIFPSAPISALRAHSVTIRPSRPVSGYALFTEIALPPAEASKAESASVTPEIYARPNDEVYACGEGDTLVPLPATSDLVLTDDTRCQDIIDYVGAISDELRDGDVLVRQACYLPNVEGKARGPLIGQTGIKGLLLAAGHTCWGIQNGPGTGKVMSEFVFEGAAKSADVNSLDPRRVLRQISRLH